MSSPFSVTHAAECESGDQEPRGSFLSCSRPSTDRTVDLRPEWPGCRHCGHDPRPHTMGIEPRGSSPQFFSYLRSRECKTSSDFFQAAAFQLASLHAADPPGLQEALCLW